ncbi:MAG: DUF4942 domain-containing protein [Chloroflexota bacterium]
MFHDEFYPTPATVIEKMIEPFLYSYHSCMKMKQAGIHDKTVIRGNRRILDPSAGSGNILTHLQDTYDKAGSYGRRSHKYFAIEIEPDLRAILKEKGFNPIAFDFLQFKPDQIFDLIVMNPPFSEGVDHLLHAWDILPHGDVVCLLNAETIRNPYTKKRELLLDLIEQYGRYEIFGPCFAEAERQTNVDVVCVWLNKPVKESTFNFAKDKFAFERHGAPDVSFGQSSELARPGIIDALVDQYHAARGALINKHRADAKYAYYTRNIISTIEHGKDESEEKVMSAAKQVEKELDELRQRFWKHVFRRTQVMEHTTSNFHDKLAELEAESGGLTFSKENIHALLHHFLMNSNQIMEDCICAVFDTMTDYHKDNKVWIEGWKTNSAFKVNRKIIIPDRANFIGWNGWQWRPYENRWLWPKLDDLDKMLCWVMEMDIEQIQTINSAISQHCDQVSDGKVEYREKFVSTFFELRVYKKGTAHLKFRDDIVWEKFNVRVATIRKWIAPQEPSEPAAPNPEGDPEVAEGEQMALVLA